MPVTFCVKAGNKLPLPAPQARSQLHTRIAVYRSYRRDDQFWDIEAQMIDTKSRVIEIPGEGQIQPGEALHNLSIRVTIDDAFVVRAIAIAMDDAPYRECSQAEVPMQTMVGCTMGRGWRQAIERNLGGVMGCAHLRELLFNMATVAFQTLSHELPFESADHPPPHLGKCMTWDFNGAAVQRHYPAFSGWLTSCVLPSVM